LFIVDGCAKGVDSGIRPFFICGNSSMVGVITKRDILAHPIVTIQCYGWIVLFQSLCARQNETFLSLLKRTRKFSESKPKSKLAELLEQCIKMELRAKRIYEFLSNKFESIPPAKNFFEVLSHQEQEHANILDICLHSASQNCYNIDGINIWLGYISILEAKMSEAETAADAITCLDDALQLTVQLESSEINKVFQAMLEASNSVFIKKMAYFRLASKAHLSYIAHMLPELSPQFAHAAREYREKILCEA
jgi:hypothetical protein